jgi:hypothetical protein
MNFNDLQWKRSRICAQTRYAHPEFPNGYGAYVIQGAMTYSGVACGCYEIAVIHANKIVYDTPVTDDVVVHLDEDGVSETLRQIAALPPREVTP